jgi:hypothetical protein
VVDVEVLDVVGAAVVGTVVVVVDRCAPGDVVDPVECADPAAWEQAETRRARPVSATTVYLCLLIPYRTFLCEHALVASSNCCPEGTTDKPRQRGTTPLAWPKILQARRLAAMPSRMSDSEAMHVSSPK